VIRIGEGGTFLRNTNLSEMILEIGKNFGPKKRGPALRHFAGSKGEK
jgi:hypothetical protein